MKAPPRSRPQASAKFIQLGVMSACPDAQRELNTHRVRELLADFDPELIGHLVVNIRDPEHVAIIDGQHRAEVLKLYLGDGWEKQQVACICYEGLNVAQEAELFLRYNNTLNVTTYSKFMVGVVAGRHDECDIKAIVEAQGLHVSKQRAERAVACVAALSRAYVQCGPDALARALRIARDAFGDVGYDSTTIMGLAKVAWRYGAQLDETVAVRKLSRMAGGAGGLAGKTRQNQSYYGCTRVDAMACSIVEAITGRNGLRLVGWWDADNPEKAATSAPRRTSRNVVTEARASA